MFLAIGFGAAAFGRGFRIYFIATLIVFIVFGSFLTFSEAPNINKNLATPFIGLWERINIAAFMVWLLVFAIILLRKKKLSTKPIIRRISSKMNRCSINSTLKQKKQCINQNGYFNIDHTAYRWHCGSLALTVHSESIKYELISHKEKMNV